MRLLALLLGYLFAMLLLYRDAYWPAVFAYLGIVAHYLAVEHVERSYRLAKERQEREWRDATWLERARGE